MSQKQNLSPVAVFAKQARAATKRGHKAEDGSRRGVRHGLFSKAVAQAEKAVLALPKGQEFTTRTVAKERGLPGWSVRVAAQRLQLQDTGVYFATIPNQGRGSQYLVARL